MKRTSAMLMISALIMLMSIGCAGTQPMTSVDSDTPLELHYDIQYVDNTAVGVEVLVVSSELPYKMVEIERGMDRAFEKVAYRIPKSAILERQAEFRDVLTATFQDETGADARLFLMNVYQTTWENGSSVVTMK